MTSVSCQLHLILLALCGSIRKRLQNVDIAKAFLYHCSETKKYNNNKTTATTITTKQGTLK
jgi:ribosome-binding protein aMBF1 (putative translation factor)